MPLDKNIKHPTEKFRDLIKITQEYYIKGNADSLLPSAQEQMKYARRLNNDSFIMASYKMLGNHSKLVSDYVTAISYYMDGLHIAEESGAYNDLTVAFYNNIGDNYNFMKDHETALIYLKRADSIITKSKAPVQNRVFVYDNIAETYLFLNKPDSALPYLHRAEEHNLLANVEYLRPPILYDYADYQKAKANLKSAEQLYQQAIIISHSLHDEKHLSTACRKYGQFLFQTGDFKNAKLQILQSFGSASKNKYNEEVINTAELLSQIYKRLGLNDSAFFYLELAVQKKDLVFNAQKNNQLSKLKQNETIRENERIDLLFQKIKENDEMLIYIGITLTIAFFIFLYLLLATSVLASPKFLRIAGVTLTLVIIEFINFFFHHRIEKITNHSILLMFLIMLALAYVLGGLHYYLDGKIPALIKYNQRIKEAFAKKILKIK